MRASDSKTTPEGAACVSQYPSELTQTLRSFLIPTSDNKPAMMPSSQVGLVGTGVATFGTGGTGGTGGSGVTLLLAAEAALVPTPFVAVTENV